MTVVVVSLVAAEYDGGGGKVVSGDGDPEYPESLSAKNKILLYKQGTLFT